MNDKRKVLKMNDKKRVLQMIEEDLVWLNKSFNKKKNRMADKTRDTVANRVKDMNNLVSIQEGLTYDQLYSKAIDISALAEQIDDDVFEFR